MTDQQFYFALGVPLASLIISVGTNVVLFVHLSSRVDALRTEMSTKFDMVIGKLGELETRVSVLEDRKSR